MDTATKIELLKGELHQLLVAAQKNTAQADARFLALFDAISANDAYFTELADAKKLELQTAADQLEEKRSELLASKAMLEAKVAAR